MAKSTKKPAAGAKRDKSAKFVELGQKRVSAAIHKIRLVRNLANRASYDFDAEQVEAIAAAINAEVEALVKRFTMALEAPDTKAETEDTFTF
jgi:hypothetical protein